MKIISAAIGVHASYGQTLLLTVDDLDPLNPVGFTVMLPTNLLKERRLFYGVTTVDTETGCECTECQLCGEAIDLVLAEHFARNNPDKLDLIEPVIAKAIVSIGGVHRKALDGTGNIVDVPEPALQAVTVTATGKLVV